jgi:8-hydroxy-5-deazaflavin:NADPH oxidoreductase
MNYGIIGIGNVGKTLAAFFAKAEIEVALANTRGPEAVEPVAKELGGKLVAKSLDEALEADIIFFAVPFS